MKFFIPFVLAGIWVALLLTGYGVLVHSEPYARQDGAKYLRCRYLKATGLTTVSIPLAGKLNAQCPQKI